MQKLVSTTPIESYSTGGKLKVKKKTSRTCSYNYRLLGTQQVLISHRNKKV